MGLMSVWKLLSRKPNLKVIEASLRAPIQESGQRQFLLCILYREFAVGQMGTLWQGSVGKIEAGLGVSCGGSV